MRERNFFLIFALSHSLQLKKHFKFFSVIFFIVIKIKIILYLYILSLEIKNEKNFLNNNDEDSGIKFFKIILSYNIIKYSFKAFSGNLNRFSIKSLIDSRLAFDITSSRNQLKS